MTLWEACAAVWVLAVTLTAAAIGGGGLLRVLNDAQMRETALRICAGALEEDARMVATGQAPPAAVQVAVGGEKISLTAQVVSAGSGLFQLTLTAAYGPPDQARSVALSTLQASGV